MKGGKRSDIGDRPDPNEDSVFRSAILYIKENPGESFMYGAFLYIALFGGPLWPSLIAGDSEPTHSVEQVDISTAEADQSQADQTGSPSYLIEIVDRSPCPEESLCSEVTVALHNRGDGDATDVDVMVELVTATSSGDETVYEESEHEDVIKSGDMVERTEKVDLGWQDVANVKSEGCTVAARVTIDSWEGTKTIWTDEEELDCSII